MRTLQFNVNGQKLSKDGDFSEIVKGSKQYLKCQFDFSEDWHGYKLIAVFVKDEKEAPVLIERDRTCLVPDEVTDDAFFKLWILGAKGSSRITTNKILIEQEG